MFNLFTDHPKNVGETYLQHMRMSFGFGWTMFSSSLACFVHGIFPFLCVKTGSTTVVTLHDRMVRHRADGVIEVQDKMGEWVPVI